MLVRVRKGKNRDNLYRLNECRLWYNTDCGGLGYADRKPTLIPCRIRVAFHTFQRQGKARDFMRIHTSIDPDIVDFRRRLYKSEKDFLFNQQNGKCFYCGVTLHSRRTHEDDGNKDPLWAVTDHRIPFCHGGRTNIENCVISCRLCNAKKGVKHG